MPSPKDLTDLFLAQVVLSVDDELLALGELEPERLALDITIDADLEPDSTEERAVYAIQRISRNVVLHGWELAWNPRGLEVSHGGRSVTLGLPDNLRRYLAGD